MALGLQGLQYYIIVVTDGTASFDAHVISYNKNVYCLRHISIDSMNLQLHIYIYIDM